MSQRLPPPLPKKASGAFKKEWQRIAAVLDLPRLAVVLEGALDRKRLEEILKKALKGKAVRPGALPRAELVTAVTELVAMNPEVAFAAMKALDKSCQRERHLVASMEEDSLEVRLNAYRAIDFRRERARLLWALVRDGREAHQKAAARILDEHFEAVAQQSKEDEGKHSTNFDDEEPTFVRSLREKVDQYEEAIHEQAEVLHQEKSERERVEQERSELMVKLGQRERAVKAEEARRREAEEEVRQLREEVRSLTEQLERLDPEKLRSAQEERDRLREKARSLERKVEHAERLSELHDENQALRAQLDEAEKDAARRDAENAQLLRQLKSREQAAQRRVESLRDSLKTARKLASAPGKKEPSVVEGEPVQDRVGVFVDATNLTASARREGQDKLDFMAMLPALVGDRRQATAVAFVVEGEQDEGGFRRFSRALSAAGYEVRSKRPRVRGDGSRKADWDMGIAMEILDARNRVDTVVLCSGDGDFVPLVRKLRHWGKRVEVASFPSSTDGELIRVADEHIDLTDRFPLA